MNDVNLLSQLIESMYDYTLKLEEAKQNNQISEFNRLKDFILKLQEKVKGEIK